MKQLDTKKTSGDYVSTSVLSTLKDCWNEIDYIAKCYGVRADKVEWYSDTKAQINTTCGTLVFTIHNLGE